MKTMKRWPALLLAALMVVMTAVPAMAASVYTPATYDDGSGGTTVAVTHTLELTESPYNLGEAIVYKFAVDTATGVTVVDPSTGVSASDVVSGNPSFTSGKDTVTYNSSDNFATATGHKVSKNLEVDWNGVTFKEPGLYSWKVNKTLDSTTTADSTKTTNVHSTTYLWASVIDDNGILKVASVNFDTKSDLTGATKPVFEDEYPAEKVNLELGKTVAGAKASKDQYFKFDVKLTLPQNIATQNYTISGNLDSTAIVQGAPYTANKSATQPGDADTNKAGTQVSLAAGENTVTVWLKHGQTIKIENLPYKTAYEITESENDGYTVAATLTGDDTDGVTNSAATNCKVIDTALKEDTTVTYTNTKAGTTPTGIILQYGAPIAGILLVIVMMTLLFVSKRRKYEEE